jgi:salicylate hydroxylase
VILENGEKMKADLVIGADGLHSEAVKHVIGYVNPTVPKGMSVFRWLMTSQEILNDPETKGLIDEYEGRAIYYVDGKAGKRIVWYGCRE